MGNAQYFEYHDKRKSLIFKSVDLIPDLANIVYKLERDEPTRAEIHEQWPELLEDFKFQTLPKYTPKLNFKAYHRWRHFSPEFSGPEGFKCTSLLPLDNKCKPYEPLPFVEDGMILDCNYLTIFDLRHTWTDIIPIEYGNKLELYINSIRRNSDRRERHATFEYLMRLWTKDWKDLTPAFWERVCVCIKEDPLLVAQWEICKPSQTLKRKRKRELDDVE